MRNTDFKFTKVKDTHMVGPIQSFGDCSSCYYSQRCTHPERCKARKERRKYINEQQKRK